MLAKKFRLPLGKEDFRSATARRSNYFSLKLKGNNLEHSRFGIILGRKLLKKATSRNKLRKIIFNFIRLRGVHFGPGSDFLIIPTAAACRATKSEIEEDLEKHLNN